MDKATRALIGNLNVLIYSQQIKAVVHIFLKNKKHFNKMYWVWTWRIFCQPLIPVNKWGFQKSPPHTQTHTTELLSDPHAIAALLCYKESSQTAFLTPDGFVQPPWKPHTPQIHWRSASSSEEEQTRTRTHTRSGFAGDIFISPLCSGVNLTCSLFIS